MPTYIYQCRCHHRTIRVMSIKQHMPMIHCEACGNLAQQIITAPLLVKARQDICYDSPIDGRPITSWDARQEDLKRNSCREYDPEMKKDAERFRKQQDEALDTAIETHVEQSIEKMPTAKRGKLYSELTEQGASAEYARSTVEP